MGKLRCIAEIRRVVSLIEHNNASLEQEALLVRQSSLVFGNGIANLVRPRQSNGLGVNLSYGLRPACER
jgi:hypothetical protein